MSLPTVVSRDVWLAERKALLEQEKRMLRELDSMHTRLRNLPMVKIEKEYVFDGPTGRVGLTDLFRGRRQLIVQHFMFDPSWDEGCSSCTAAVDELSDGLLRHLNARETTLAIIARAPLPKIDKYRAARGWTMPIYSSFDTDFNYDFHVTLDASVTPIEFNFRGPEELAAAGFDWILKADDQPMEQPGMSCFLRVGDDIFHTYSTFARGTEQLGGAYGFLDMTALGRQEDWEEPKGRADTERGAIPDFSD